MLRAGRTTTRWQPRASARRCKAPERQARACCLGAGGVGKTTTSAALAFGLAARGAKVAVVTIDPARRLAAALGLGELSGEPRQIDPALLAEQGVAAPGELWAMALDAKRTFDEVVTRLAPDEARARRSSKIPSTRSCPRPSPACRSSAP